MKQTAVEWLTNHILNSDFGTDEEWQNVFEQAKEMEKQQIIETCADWWNEGASYMYDGKRNYLSFEQYYNETFKSE